MLALRRGGKRIPLVWVNEDECFGILIMMNK